MSIKNKKTLLAVILMGLLVSATANAQAGSPGENLTVQKIVGIFTYLACYMARIALIIIVIMLVYYGIMFMMARENPSKLAEAKKAFGWGLVGVLVILGTYTIIASVVDLVSSTGGGSLNADTILGPLYNCQ